MATKSNSKKVDLTFKPTDIYKVEVSTANGLMVEVRDKSELNPDNENEKATNITYLDWFKASLDVNSEKLTTDDMMPIIRLREKFQDAKVGKSVQIDEMDALYLQRCVEKLQGTWTFAHRDIISFHNYVEKLV